MTDRTLKPIAYASRALLPAEKNYSQIEKEDLRIIFVVSKFYRHIYAIFTVNVSHYKQTPSQYSPFLAPNRSSYKYNQQTAEMEYNPIKLQLQNGVPTIQKIRPCWWIVKTNSQVQRTTGRYSDRFLQCEGELKTTLCNTVRELRGDAWENKKEALRDEHVNQIKAKIF